MQPNHGPLVSIVICSYNRSSDVSECFAALHPQIVDQVEVILVDSGSDFKHQAELAKLATLYPKMKLTRVDKPGVSSARNHGVQLAAGDWVAFLDDDAVPFPDWLANLLAKLTAASPTQAVIAGGIYPRWPEGMSGEHLSKRWKMFLSLAEAERPGSVADGYPANCANYAIRRRILLDIGGFSERLGRIGASLISGEESHVTKNVLIAGLGATFDPAFKVYHKIGRERLKVSWILKRTFWEGITGIRISRACNLSLPTHLRLIKLIASLPILLFLSIVHFRNHDYKIRLAMCLGACMGVLTASDHEQYHALSKDRRSKHRGTK